MPFVHPTAEDLAEFETSLAAGTPDTSPLKIVLDDEHTSCEYRRSVLVSSPTGTDDTDPELTSRVCLDEETYEFPIPRARSPIALHPPHPHPRKARSSGSLLAAYYNQAPDPRRRSTSSHVRPTQSASLLLNATRSPIGPARAARHEPPLSHASSPTSTDSTPNTPVTPSPTSISTPIPVSSFLDMDDPPPTLRTRIPTWGRRAAAQGVSGPTISPRSTHRQVRRSASSSEESTRGSVGSLRACERGGLGEALALATGVGAVLAVSPASSSAGSIFPDERRRSFLYLPEDGTVRWEDPFANAARVSPAKSKASTKFWKALGAWRGHRDT